MRKLNLLLVTAGVLVAWNALSAVWAIDRVSSLDQAFTYLQLWVMIWLLWQFIESSSQARSLRQAYMLGTWVTIGTIVWSYLTHNPTIDPTRFTAFDTNANYTAQSIALAIPMAFDAAVHGRTWSRLSAVLLIAASLYGIALTGSRGGAVIAALALVASILLILRGRAVAKAIALLVLVAAIGGLAAILPTDMVQRFAGTLSEVETADFSGRGEIWEAGFEVWLNRPAVGVGSGNFSAAIVPIFGSSHAAHNSFLNLLVELGPIGPTLFLLLFLVAIWPHLLVLVARADRSSPGACRHAGLQVVLLAVLLVTQLPSNWQYQRVTWYLLIAATFDCALFLTPARALAANAKSHAG